MTNSKCEEHFELITVSSFFAKYGVGGSANELLVTLKYIYNYIILLYRKPKNGRSGSLLNPKSTQIHVSNLGCPLEMKLQ